MFVLLAKGRGTAYIQDKLYISPHTVKSHTYKIYRKLGVSSREELLTLVENADVYKRQAPATMNSETLGTYTFTI